MTAVYHGVVSGALRRRGVVEELLRCLRGRVMEGQIALAFVATSVPWGVRCWLKKLLDLVDQSWFFFFLNPEKDGLCQTVVLAFFKP